MRARSNASEPIPRQRESRGIRMAELVECVGEELLGFAILVVPGKCHSQILQRVERVSMLGAQDSELDIKGFPRHLLGFGVAILCNQHSCQYGLSCQSVWVVRAQDAGLSLAGFPE